mmetsp:Transcript_11651/g.26967  ORF Transcript_11651/g.26967 Transcript_11651/m.26967 type:complete len:120 (+) Transcript_11651:64-423(+)
MYSRIRNDKEPFGFQSPQKTDHVDPWIETKAYVFGKKWLPAVQKCLTWVPNWLTVQKELETHVRSSRHNRTPLFPNTSSLPSKRTGVTKLLHPKLPAHYPPPPQTIQSNSPKTPRLKHE